MQPREAERNRESEREESRFDAQIASYSKSNSLAI